MSSRTPDRGADNLPNAAPPTRRRQARRGRVAGVAFSVAAHLSLLAAFAWTKAETPKLLDPAPIGVSLFEGPLLHEGPKAVAAAPTQAVAPPPEKTVFRKVEAPRAVEPLFATEDTPKPVPTPVLSDGEMAMAATAEGGPGAGGGGGGGGGGCNMVRHLQAALRKDPRIQAEVARAHREAGVSGKAVVMWNGDWVKTSGQEGAGLAGVREALMVEILFAPEACRAEPVRGNVMIALEDGPGGARLALGANDWRWSELLLARSTVRPRSF